MSDDRPADPESHGQTTSADATQLLRTFRLPDAQQTRPAISSVDGPPRSSPEPALGRHSESIETTSSDATKNRDALAFRVLCCLPLGSTLGLLVGLSLFTESAVPISLKMFFTAVLLLSIRRWTGSILLLFVLVDLLVHERRRSFIASPGESTIFVVVVLSLIMLISRFRTLRQADGRSMIRLLQSMLGGFSQPAAQSANHPNRHPGPSARNLSQFAGQTFVSIGTTVVLLVAAAITAVVIIGQMPRLRFTREWLQENANGDLSLWPGPLLLVLVVTTILILNEIGWRNLSPRQSRLYLRSVFVNLNFRDLKMITRRRIKSRLKRSRKPV